MAWLKTVTNAWCTSYRMHEPDLLKCIFGCRGHNDDLSHYLECHVLWSHLNEAFVGHVAPCKAGKVNYLNPTKQKVIIISSAFETYHALKISLKHVVVQALSTSRFAEINRIAMRLITERRDTHPGLFPVCDRIGQEQAAWESLLHPSSG